MNDWEKDRERGKTLLIVEGHHEKEELFYRLIRCYPELNIDQEHIKIYGTNIYVLHRAIVEEYGEDWKTQDVDLPYLVSKDAERIYGADFVNILLIFDYERHDPYFSEGAINDLLDYFCDATNKGKLYINYPMVEAYEHLDALPDPNYEDLKISTSLRPGIKYKELVRGMKVTKIMDFPEKLKQVLQRAYHVSDGTLTAYAEQLLALDNSADLEKNVQTIMSPILDIAELEMAVHHLPKLLCCVGHLAMQQSFWTFLRSVFSEIIIHNICKANKIQTGNYRIEHKDLKERFQSLSEVAILQKQNEASRDETAGFIWVLNTSVFFVAEYNISLVLNNRNPST